MFAYDFINFHFNVLNTAYTHKNNVLGFNDDCYINNGLYIKSSAHNQMEPSEP
jgi:hypothetical protein